MIDVENIEESIKGMNLHRVQKKGDELSSQEYDKDITFQYKKKKPVLLKNNIPLTCIMKRKGKLPKITPPAMMEL